MQRVYIVEPGTVPAQDLHAGVYFIGRRRTATLSAGQDRKG